MTAPLEDYAMIGDRRTAALVCRNGSIDWLCWPRFDSDACFAALLGFSDHGSWVIAPEAPADVSRRYQDGTMVLETDFEAVDFAVRLTDFMPIRTGLSSTGLSSVVRIVEGLRGQVPMRFDLRIRFDYGKLPLWTEATPDGLLGHIGPDLVVLRGPVPFQISHQRTTAAFNVCKGQRLVFMLQYGDACEPPPAAFDPFEALAETQRDWRDWIGQFDKPTDWPEATRRSLLTLRALIDARSGGLVAAPTTSLPETPGGPDNWDYRFCWLRDATFTISALLNAGYHQEALDWRDWILRALGGTPSELRILYRVDGSRHVTEWEVDWLPGYRYARPVRVGNKAAVQRQIDVLGEVLDTMGLSARVGLEITSQQQCISRAIAERIEALWREMGQGIWESRGEPRHYTYGKVMAWVGIDRVLRHEQLLGDVDPNMRQRLQRLRAEIHRDVCEEGYHTGLESFVQYYGGEMLDASLLLMPLVGFLPVDDPRIANTIAAIERELMQDGLVRRKAPSGDNPEGAFLACSCWLADCREMQGRRQEAREVLERLLSVGNDVGLLSEQYDLRGKCLSGNFPQALTHLAVVTSTLGLSGPIVQRSGV